MSGPVFGSYASYYNLLYRDKDYAGEANYLHELIQKLVPGAKSILNLGCGTGSHDFELARLGYQVCGVDMSAEMLTVAHAKLSSFPKDLLAPSFVQGDIRDVRLGNTFDVVISLFHVICYQTGNDDLKSAFATAASHLVPGGLFLFDYWYGPAVLTDPPVVRVKRLEDDVIEVLRITEPMMHHDENLVDVSFEVLITNKKSHETSTLRELHRMRYMFLPEISLHMELAGLKPCCCHKWLSFDPPGADSWYVISGARKFP